MKIANNAVVSIHYTLTDKNEEVIDSSVGGEPLSYLHGSANIIPGLEQALDGKAIGDQFKVTVEPSDGYGEHDDQLVQSIPKEFFQGVESIEPGMRFKAQDSQGSEQVIKVKEVKDEEVVVDGNHPLAGETLYFDVKVEAVRAATDEEIDHGHVHA